MKNPLEGYNYDQNMEMACDHIKDGHYDHVLDQSLEIMNSGRRSGFYIPGVKLMLDLSLQMLKEAKITDEVKEVFDRQVVATGLVGESLGKLYCSNITNPDANNNPLINLYDRHQGIKDDLMQLHPKNTPSRQLSLTIKPMISLCQAPYQDIRLVSGGVMRFLEANGIKENPEDVLKNSPSLQVISGVSGVQMPVIARELGMPYFISNRFELDTSEKQKTKIKYSERTMDIIRDASQDTFGCPARIIKNKDTGSNYVKEYWNKIGDYLVSNNAAVLHCRLPGVSLLNEEL